MRLFQKSPDFSARGLAVVGLAIGATAVGAMAIGALAIRRLLIREGRIEKFSIGELTVDAAVHPPAAHRYRWLGTDTPIDPSPLYTFHPHTSAAGMLVPFAAQMLCQQRSKPHLPIAHCLTSEGKPRCKNISAKSRRLNLYRTRHKTT
jgi:hypothetical protein